MKDLQKQIAEFCQRNQMESPIEHRLLDVLSEFGEVAKEILKMSNYGRNEFVYNDKIKGELGDLLYSIITVANTFNIDLEDEVKNVLAKYQKRIDEKGDAGSGS